MKEKIKTRDAKGELYFEIEGEVFGFFVVHKSDTDKKKYVLTHLKTGVKAFPRLNQNLDKHIAIYAAIRLSGAGSLFNFTWEDYKEAGYRPPLYSEARRLISDLEDEIVTYEDPRTYEPINYNQEIRTDFPFRGEE